jgi:arylsulfatase
MKELGVLPPGAEALPPRHEPRKSWDANPAREWDARAMAVHAAMVERMDRGVGRLVAKLREMNELDDTLILFLSDNGASPEIMKEPGFDRPSQTRDGRAIAYTHGDGPMPGPQTTFGAIGPFWASVANTPMRFWKAEMYEGGICTPLIAHWPKGVQPKAGAVTHAVGHVMDVMPTCVELAGATYPATFEGREISPAAGTSLAPVLRGERTSLARDVLAWEHIGARAIREGDWKLVSRRTGPWALYDLSSDRGEQNDLSATHPDRVRAMEAAWQRWADASQVFPAPGGARRVGQ